MVVFSKKRIEIIVSCLIIGLFVFSVQISNQKSSKDENNSIEQKSSIETTATPVSGKTVVIDAGHGVPDERALRLPKTQATNLLQEKLLTNGIKTLYN